MEGTQVDFTGQHVYVGLDVAKRGWKVCVLVGELFHKRFSQQPDCRSLANYLRRNIPGGEYHCVYEAGHCGFWIHDELRQLGIDCIVTNPADVPTTDKERHHKTDSVDAGKLARHLRSKELRAIYVPNRSAMEDRTLLIDERPPSRDLLDPISRPALSFAGLRASCRPAAPGGNKTEARSGLQVHLPQQGLIGRVRSQGIVSRRNLE